MDFRGKVSVIYSENNLKNIDVYYNHSEQSDEISNEEIGRSLVRLFDKETDNETSGYTVDEQYAIDSFLRNIKREKDGRYTVSPLFKENAVPLKNNYYHALKRYRALRKTLEQNEIKNKIYCDSIDTMIRNGEVKLVQESPKVSKDMDAYLNYLPHHGVFKMERISTKCRIVFDGSAKNSEDISLNDNLLAGPKKQLDIAELLIKFRVHPYTIVGDISRMFYCVNLDPRHQHYY